MILNGLDLTMNYEDKNEIEKLCLIAESIYLSKYKHKDDRCEIDPRVKVYVRASKPMKFIGEINNVDYNNIENIAKEIFSRITSFFQLDTSLLSDTDKKVYSILFKLFEDALLDYKLGGSNREIGKERITLYRYFLDETVKYFVKIINVTGFEYLVNEAYSTKLLIDGVGLPDYKEKNLKNGKHFITLKSNNNSAFLTEYNFKNVEGKISSYWYTNELKKELIKDVKKHYKFDNYNRNETSFFSRKEVQLTKVELIAIDLYINALDNSINDALTNEYTLFFTDAPKEDYWKSWRIEDPKKEFQLSIIKKMANILYVQ